MTFRNGREHILAELRRLDLILLTCLHRHRPSTSDEPPPPRSASEESVFDLLESEKYPGSNAADPDLETRLRACNDTMRESVRDALDQGIRLPLLELCRTYALDATSINLLILAVAPHLDLKYERVYAFLQGDPARPQPRIELALSIFARSASDRITMRALLESGAPLLRSGWFEVVELPGMDCRSWLGRALSVSPRLIRYLLDLEGAEPVVEAMTARQTVAPSSRSQQKALERFARLWPADALPAPVGIIRTEDPEALLEAASALARSRGLEPLALDLAAPAAHAWSAGERIRAAFREARLQQALLMLYGLEELASGQEEVPAELLAHLSEFDGPCLLVSQDSFDLRREARRRRVVPLETRLPDAAERSELWKRSLNGTGSAVSVTELAWRFRLGASQICDAAHTASYLGDEGDTDTLATLMRACQQQSHHQLGTLAQRVSPRGRWHDLVLPPESLQQLRELVRHHRYRDRVLIDWGFGARVPYGQGTTALFAGPPGTGKTMAASIVAAELGLELFRIDLSGVVSKYIGETEKNLDRVFRAAHRCNAILFFDEADALFGKRTEVKDAHDRYANIETSYLLQKLEEFDGITILATNLKKHIDPAFMRRIVVSVDFPQPDREIRHRLWKVMIPPSMPIEEPLQLELLAERFELSGGQVKNAVHGAALRAAAEGRGLGIDHLLLAIRRELQKQGKITNAPDFGELAPLLERALQREQTRAVG